MASRKGGEVNNAFYDSLGERWYTAQDDPVGLLRAESRKLIPWVVAEIGRVYSGKNPRVLDVGCGAGFLANELARMGLKVTGIDASERSLEVARKHDCTSSVEYRCGSALALPFPDRSFEVVSAMDFLEHIEDPEQVLGESARVLVPGGLFFFHTFNRNIVSYLVVIKGVEWFVRNTPPGMHRLRCFIKPAELGYMCSRVGLDIEHLRGLVPVLWKSSFWKMIFTGRIADDFAFRFVRLPITGYAGRAVRIS